MSLQEKLNDLYREVDETLRQKWDRSFSFADGLFDRWERAERLGFGEGSSIYNSSLVYGDVKVGKNVWIGPYTLLDGSRGGITIGDYCSIATGVLIYTHDAVMYALSGGKIPYRGGPVTIGDCCFIASQSIITYGVTIGRKCLVAGNSLVNDDVPDRTVVGGTPAKPIGVVWGEGANTKIIWHK